MEALLARLRRSPLRIALDHPVGAMVALSFGLMTAVVGIEQIEKGPPAIAWVSRHRSAIALIKQALCVASIPGFLLLMYGGEASRWSRTERSVALALTALAAVAMTYFILAR